MLRPRVLLLAWAPRLASLLARAMSVRLPAWELRPASVSARPLRPARLRAPVLLRPRQRRSVQHQARAPPRGLDPPMWWRLAPRAERVRRAERVPRMRPGPGRPAAPVQPPRPVRRPRPQPAARAESVQRPESDRLRRLQPDRPPALAPRPASRRAAAPAQDRPRESALLMASGCPWLWLSVTPPASVPPMASQ